MHTSEEPGHEDGCFLTGRSRVPASSSFEEDDREQLREGLALGGRSKAQHGDISGAVACWELHLQVWGRGDFQNHSDGCLFGKESKH